MRNEKREFNNSLKKIAKSSVIVLAGLFLSKIFNYVYRIVIARSLGPEAYGLFSLAIMLSGWAVILASLGLGEGIVRYVSVFRGNNEKGKVQYLFQFTTKLFLITGLIGFLVLFFSAEFISVGIFDEPGLTIFLKFFSIAVPLTIFLSLYLATLRGHEYIGWTSLIQNVLGPGTKLSSMVVLLLAGFSLGAIFGSYLAGIAIPLIIAIIVSRKKIRYAFKKSALAKDEQSQVFREVLRYSWPLLFAGFMWRMFHWTDSFVIGYFLDAVDVGIYNAAIPIVALIHIPSQLFMQLFFPLVSRENAKGDRETVKQLSQQVGKWVFALSIPTVILMVVFARSIVRILFGTEFAGATTALIILSTGTFFIAFFEIAIRLLATIGKSKLILVDVCCIAGVNALLNIVLVPRYGIEGAALATAVSLTVLSVILGVQTWRHTGIIPVRRTFAQICLAAGISLGIVYPLAHAFGGELLIDAMLGILFILSYCLLLLVLKAFDYNDRMIVKSALRRRKKNKK